MGQAFHYEGSVLMIVEKRRSDLVGFEYMVLLNGEVHGWLTESVMEGLKTVKFERGEEFERNNQNS